MSPSSLSMDDVPPPPFKMNSPSDMPPPSDVALPHDVSPRPDMSSPPDAAAHSIVEADAIAMVRVVLPPVVATLVLPHDVPRPTSIHAVHRYVMNGCPLNSFHKCSLMKLIWFVRSDLEFAETIPPVDWDSLQIIETHFPLICKINSFFLI